MSTVEPAVVAEVVGLILFGGVAAAAAMSIMACAYLRIQQRVSSKTSSSQAKRNTRKRKEGEIGDQNANFFRRNSIVDIDGSVVEDGELRGVEQVRHRRHRHTRHPHRRKSQAKEHKVRAFDRR